MNAPLYDAAGRKKAEIKLPNFFTIPIREDLVAKAIECERQEQRQPYASFAEAGKRHSASGTISHRRHKWKSGYGRGMSRVPRKVMWRRGTQFYWIGAEVANTRGGRRAHPPQGIRRYRKLNRKEQNHALASALAATAAPSLVSKRYTSLSSPPSSLPAVIEQFPTKARDMRAALIAIFGTTLLPLLFRHREVRAGLGKLRGRKYKTNAALLLVTGNSEVLKQSLIESKQASRLQITDLYPLGRLTLYTQQALKELQARVQRGTYAA